MRLFLIALLFLPIYSYSQYSEVMDSIVSVIGKQINVELVSEGYNVVANMMNGKEMLGSIIQLESCDISSSPMLIYSIGVSEKKYRKSVRTKKIPYFKRSLYWQSVMNTIKTQRNLPIKKIRYKFIALLKDSPPDVILYGEYQFLFDENEGLYEIVNKRNELYEGESTIRNIFELEF